MDSCTSKPGIGIQCSSEIMRKTDKIKMSAFHQYHSAEIKDTSLARNLFPEIIMSDMFGIGYGRDW